MAKDRMGVLELLRKKARDADLEFQREGIRILIQAMMEAEVATKTEASFGEPSPERDTYRDAYRVRPLGHARWTPWERRSRRCGRAATSPLCSNPAGAANGPCSPSCSRPMWGASPPAASRTSCKRRLRGHLQEPGLC